MKLLAAPDKSRRPSKLADDPTTLAEAYERSKRPVLTGQGGEKSVPQVLYHFRDEYYWWDGTTYRVVPRKRVHNDLYRFLRGLNVTGVGRGNYKCQPDVRLVNKVIDALDSVCECDAPHMPVWLGDEGNARPEVVAFANGLLDVGAYLAGDESILLPAAPQWFDTAVSPVRFDRDAKCPQWLAFLDQVFGGDREQVDVLQEWFGYCLTRDTSLNKMLQVYGPGRSGKGTIEKVITGLLGVGNCDTPDLADLKGFGLETLQGKQLAICSDAVIGRNDDAKKLVGVLKRISAGDLVNINRKHVKAREAQKLDARIMISANDVLDLPDTSGVIITRFLFLETQQSFLGREDTGLVRRLLEELPGIAVWAMEGLGRLREQGSFTDARVTREGQAELIRMSSPMTAFIEDQCVTLKTAPDFGVQVKDLDVPVQTLFEAWETWATKNKQEVGSLIGFGRRMKSLGFKRAKVGGKADREWSYVGLDLKSRLGPLFN